MPCSSYTDPKVASVGLSRRAAEEQRVALDTYSTSLAHNDRAILEGTDDQRGLVQVQLHTPAHAISRDLP